MRLIEEALWTACCKGCGYEVSGTAEFAFPEYASEVQSTILFRLESLSQILIIREIVEEVAGISAMGAAREVRAADMIWRVGPIRAYGVEEYCRQAVARGITALVEK